MKRLQNDDLSVVIPTENSVEEFFLAFKENYTNFSSDNLIIDFSDFKGVKTENILLLLPTIEGHRNNGMSFVIICADVDPDSLPDTVAVVPTLTEAKDIIEMEKIERDLGF